MKKAFSLFLVLLLCLSLCACSEGAQSTADTFPSQNNNSLIEFENVVLVDNDTVKVELVNFYAKDFKWNTGVENEKHITVKVTNKSDHDIVMIPVNFYLGDEAVDALVVTDSIRLAPGKHGNYPFMIRYYTSPNETHVNSLEELYTLEGSFTGVVKYEDVSKNTALNVDFNIQTAINAAG